MNTKYDYNTILSLQDANDIRSAIRITVVNYMHYQLGWSMQACEKRVIMEENRTIPKTLFDDLQKRGWHLRGSRLLDVGAGQGGAIIEALDRGADAYGIEPGEEFLDLAQMRLVDAGHAPDRIRSAYAESLPFPDDHFDYLISLQVLEHVRDPFPVLSECYRVLKPGGQCFISCENYLSFREQHYRIFWLPMLPKPLGALYLRSIGRNPDFLNKYVYYTTYPQIWRQIRKVGFENITHDPLLLELQVPTGHTRGLKRLISTLTSHLPARHRRQVLLPIFHLRNVFKVGVTAVLRKPLPQE